MEHLYYSYPPPPHATPGPPPHGGPLSLSSDQQLLVYTTEISGQPSANDSQLNQEVSEKTIYLFFLMLSYYFFSDNFALSALQRIIIHKQ